MVLYDNNPPLVIAEAGVNHNGSLDIAFAMVDAAASAGADYIKFQTFKTENLVTPSAFSATYQAKNCNASSQLEMLRSLELSEEDFIKIKKHCKLKNIGFLSTPFDLESLLFLKKLGMDFIKVPSGEITDLPFLRAIAETRTPVIVSTGMSEVSEISDALKVFENKGYGKSDIILLHCNTQYPTPYEDVNLRAMISLRETFGYLTGYSDHTNGIEVPVAATALGAMVIEKHFTLNREMNGPDHAASLSPDELRQMVKSIKNTFIALGSSQKRVSLSESENIPAARKSIVAARNISKGEVLTADNLTCKRPGTGLSPMLWDDVIGSVAVKDYEKNDLIEF